MARITVDDCLKRIPNRFQLTLAATYRARQVSTGASPMVEPNKDKPTVIALREIATGKVGLEVLKKTKALDPPPPVVLVTAHGDIPTAVQAMNEGAFSFIEKPRGRPP